MRLQSIVKTSLILLTFFSWDLRASVRVIGTVTDKDSRPLPGVSVEAVGVGQDVTTASGSFAIDFPDSRIGTQVSFQVRRGGWHIADEHMLHLIVPRDPIQTPMKIIMVPDLVHGSIGGTAVRQPSLRFEVENAKQIKENIGKQPQFQGRDIFCDSMRINLLLAHSLNSALPVRVNAIEIHSRPLPVTPGSNLSTCNLDNLSAHPYGIVETNAFVITSGDQGLAAKFIVDASTAYPVEADNILRSAAGIKAVTLKQGEEPIAFDILLESKATGPQEIYFVADYDADGPQTLSTPAFILWR